MKKNNLQKKPTVIDLFCGAGGFSEGFKQAGYQVLLGIDNIEIFIETFKANHENTIAICEDIRKITVKDVKKKITNKNIDIIIGGPPCQGFSAAGRRDKNDPRNSLFVEFIRFVDGLKPKYFVMENVRGLLSMSTANGEPVIEIIRTEFEKIGYKFEYRVLLATNYGVPQKRYRVIFIGTNTNRSITFPNPTHNNKSQSELFGKIFKEWVPVKNVLLKETEVDKSFFHSEKMIAGFRRRKEKNKSIGNGFGWQILNLDKPSYTISARYWKDGSDALVKYSDDRIRMLTPFECARIQSFPSNYKFMGSKRDIYTQIGNAVPPLMAKAIAEEIKHTLI